MTKLTAKYYVFRNKKHGDFLKKFHDKGTLAYHTDYTEDIHKALTLIPEAYGPQKKELKMLAKALDCEIIEVNATYELTYPNGDEVREIEKDDRDEFKALLKEIMAKSIFGGDE